MHAVCPWVRAHSRYFWARRSLWSVNKCISDTWITSMLAVRTALSSATHAHRSRLRSVAFPRRGGPRFYLADVV